MKIVLIISITFTLLYLYLFRRLNSLDKIVRESINPHIFFKEYINFTGYIILVEKDVLLNDLLFYRKIINILKKRRTFKIIRIDFDKSKDEEINLKLFNHFNVKSVTSIYYYNNIEKILIYDFYNTNNLNIKETCHDLKKKITNGGMV